MSNKWIKDFTPVERLVSLDIEEVVNSYEWMLFSLSGMTSMALFLVASSHTKRGDYLGACLSSIGAILSALAPVIAKTFSI